MWLLLLQRFGHANRQVVAAPGLRRVRCRPLGGPVHVRVADERPRAEHARAAASLLVRRSVGGLMRAIGLVTVLDPLERVAMHVVEDEGVWRERCDGRGLIEPGIAPLGLAAEAGAFFPEVAVVVIDRVAP